MRAASIVLFVLATVVSIDAVHAAPPVHARIADVYRMHCERCHGERGDGDGPAARALVPRPRDFAEGDFKLRSTASGDVPTDADLERTVRRGVPGTAMPAFEGRLNDAETRAVIAVLKSFSPRFDVDGPGMPLELPPAPPADAGTLSRGHAAYARLACASCHGASGRGDGPVAGELRDAMNLATRPRDLTRRSLYKGGAEPAEIFRTLTTGMHGTAMTPHGTRTTQRERWDLAYYLASLARGR